MAIMTYYLLEHRSNLHDNYRRVFSIAGHDLLLLQHQGTLHLLDNICPHAGYPMTDAQLIGTNLRCPMHGYLFAIDDGACVAAYEGPCRDLPTYRIEYREQEIGVML